MKKSLGIKLIIYLTEIVFSWAALRMNGVYFWYAASGEMSLSTLLSRITTRSIYRGVILLIFLIFLIIISDILIRISRADILFGALSAVTICMGECIEHLSSVNIFRIGDFTFILIIWIFGWGVIGTYFMAWLRAALRGIAGKRASNFLKRFYVKSDLIYWLLSSLFIFVCYLPYIIIRYPAAVEWDAYHQVLQTLGFETLTAHWPPLSSLFMGGLVSLGKRVTGSYNAGFFLLVFLQSLIIALVLGYTFLFLRKISTPPGIRAVLLLIVSIVPIFPAYLCAAVKDAMYAASVLLFTVCLGEIFILNDDSRLSIIRLGIVGILMSLLRNNGIYVVYGAVIALIVLAVKNKKKATAAVRLSLISLIVVCIFYMSYTKLMLPALNITQDREVESLSVPLQQTARYLMLYPDDLSEDEREALSKAVNIDGIVGAYDPVLADSAKSYYRGDQSALPGYLFTWAKLFFRHPGVYIDAFLNMNYGFLYPGEEEQIGLWVDLYYGSGDFDSGITLFSRPAGLYRYALGLWRYACLWRLNIITFWMVSIGMYGLLTLWLSIVSACSRRHQRYFIFFVPGIVGLLVCLAGPTSVYNNGMRYALPLVLSLPLLTGIMLRDDTITAA